MSFELVAQEIVYARLNGQVGATVYDTPPQLPEAMPDSNFPYVVIGDDTGAAWDTDDTLGGEITVTLHFWSRAKSKKQVKTIMLAAYNRLHRANLTKTGYKIVDCLWQFSEVFDDPDGATKHGVQRYLLTMQKEN